ncbi:LysR family transcriptional regulator [Bordetella genomosp. 10]|uniref:LysR family transcriptional regulator n=1 Tax=Bordetella genomosp. 10 TaxID=1416804 RepID=A0A261RY57_9BORD|nr:LysR substrate-binding domain-containing protein [Bordetella genomosp. 10]OZI29821.1 LysR family transcriptional regulator [Bordetella genomosp. 10]
MLPFLLAAFYETARQGSMTAAAKQLRISQPTVTSRIQQLESGYGVELFHRRGGRLALTRIGTELMPLARQMMQIQHDIDFKLRNGKQMLSGSLHIGATGPNYIASIICGFREQYPDARIGIEVGNSRSVLEALFDARVDLAVASEPLNDERLLRREIATDPLVLVAHRAHPLAGRAGISLHDLAAHTLLLRERGSWTRSLMEEAMNAHAVNPRAVLEMGSREMICRAVQHNLGCTLMPVRDVPRDDNLRTVAIEPDPPLLRVYLYCMRERASMPLAEAFIASLPGASMH